MRVDIVPVASTEVVIRLSRDEARQLHSELHAVSSKSSMPNAAALVWNLTNAKVQLPGA